MCQLNIFCVPKSVDKAKVLELMKSVFGYQVAECIDEENPIPRLSKEYSFYISGGMRCNCDSALCAHQDRENMTWEEIKAELKTEQLKKLNAIKEVLLLPDYAERRAKFEKKQTELWQKIDALTAHVGKIERELADKVMSRADITDEQKSQIMHEEVYPKINELMDEATGTPEYLSVLKEYQDFCAENSGLWDSVVYSLVRTNPETSTFIKLEDLLGNNENAETFEDFIPSNSIYDAIERAENEDYKHITSEYDDILKFIDEITALANDIKIFCYWQDGGEPTVDSEKTLSVNQFTIDECIKLKYNELLTITK